MIPGLQSLHYLYLISNIFLLQRESVQRDAERERKLRAESEVRMREAGAEATRYRTRLKFLTQEFAK